MDETSANPPEKGAVERRRNQFAAELAELRQKALADLELRGYAVRGKTPAQIRRVLSVRPHRHGKEQ